MQRSAVPHSRRRSRQYSAIQHSTLKHSTIQYTTVQRRQCSTLRCITIQYTSIQGSTVPYRRRTVDSTVQYNTQQLITLFGEVIHRVFDALNSSSNLVVEISWGGSCTRGGGNWKTSGPKSPTWENSGTAFSNCSPPPGAKHFENTCAELAAR